MWTPAQALKARKRRESRKKLPWMMEFPQPSSKALAVVLLMVASICAVAQAQFTCDPDQTSYVKESSHS